MFLRQFLTFLRTKPSLWMVGWGCFGFLIGTRRSFYSLLLRMVWVHSEPISLNRSSFFTELALWAYSVIKSLCSSVCLFVCLSAPSQNTHFRLSGRHLVEECIPNIGLGWPNFQPKKAAAHFSEIVKTQGFGTPLPNTHFRMLWRLLVKGRIPNMGLRWNN